MRHLWILLTPLLAAGCATPSRVATTTPPAAPVLAAASPTNFAETPYAVRGYRDAANPALRHEPHTVYRRTRIAAESAVEIDSEPRTSRPLATVAPLPASDELAAELAAQRKITAELRETQASVAEIEQKIRAQYAVLVKQSAEAARVREELEAERNRLQSVAAAAPARTAEAVPATANAEVKW